MIEEIDWFKIRDKPYFKFDDLEETKGIKYLDLSNNCHNGQRKLFLSEVYFYETYKPDIVVYSGSASGEHTDLILKLFPNLKLIMVDPNYHMFKYKAKYIYKNNKVIGSKHKETISERRKGKYEVTFFNGERHNVLDDESHGSIDDFDVKKMNRVSIIQDYMSENIAKKLREKLKNIFYVSDIRTTLFDTGNVSDLDILYNSALQAIVLNALKPRYSMLKFVIPTYIGRKSEWKKHMPPYVKKLLNRSKDFGFNFLEDYDKKIFKYYDGEIFLQPWATNKSLETRLIIGRNLTIKEYNMLSYYRKMFFYNIFRSVGYIEHKEVKGYDHSNDSSLELYILRNFHITKEIIDKHIISNDVKCSHTKKITKPLTEFTYTYEEDYKKITKTILKNNLM